MFFSPIQSEIDEEKFRLDRRQRSTTAAVFVLSLVLWPIVAINALTGLGFIVWTIPAALSIVGGIVGFLFQIPFFEDEFSGPILAFTLFASIQNAAMTYAYFRWKNESRFIRISFWIIVTFFALLVISTAAFTIVVSVSVGMPIDIYMLSPLSISDW